MCVHVCGHVCVWMEYFYDEIGMEDMVVVVVVVVWVGARTLHVCTVWEGNCGLCKKPW